MSQESKRKNNNINNNKSQRCLRKQKLKKEKKKEKTKGGNWGHFSQSSKLDSPSQFFPNFREKIFWWSRG